MSEIPTYLYYTDQHEYLKPDPRPGVFTVGITDYAQGELGDVVFLELPAIGATFQASEVMGTIEAVKAVSDIYCPVAGEVMEVNTSLDKDPALVNSDPYGKGWMVRLKPSNLSQVDDLLDAEEYRTLVGK
ncbi:MAG: glycine cleavage system protein GcvH [Gemmatimonadetes bacterium]|nr:glycine cleavage system protein GcvH [Gemmatimonadota bacterium]